MNPAHIITAYLEEHGEKYDLTNSASIRVLALDLQDALDDLHCSLGEDDHQDRA